MVPDRGKDIAQHLSIEIAINVLIDAETDTPWKYDTVLQRKIPRIHATKKMWWLGMNH